MARLKKWFFQKIQNRVTQIIQKFSLKPKLIPQLK